MNVFNKEERQKILSFSLGDLNSFNTVITNYLEENTFNNIEILLNQGKILSLQNHDLFNKIATRKAGGYCFEHNKLFFYALKSSGIQCTSHLARVVYGKSIDVPKTHRLTIVQHQGQSFLADVGFGPNTPTKMIPFSGEEIKCHNEIPFRIKKIGDNDFSLERFKDDDFFTLYTFDRNLYTEADFDLSNYYTNTHCDSKFTESLIISKYASNKILFINDLVLSEITKEKRIDTPIQSAEMLKETLQTHFLIELSSNEAEKLFTVPGSKT